MKRRFWTSFEFTAISVRSISPPCEGGVRGGGPGGAMARYAGSEPLGLAELPAWPSMFVMPCPPPLERFSDESGAGLGQRPSLARRASIIRHRGLVVRNSRVNRSNPPSQGGGKGLTRSHCHSIARPKYTRLETVPRARPTVSFHHPRARGNTVELIATYCSRRDYELIP
jgi:hypothetical protein